jgi:hypothetical protein
VSKEPQNAQWQRAESGEITQNHPESNSRISLPSSNMKLSVTSGIDSTSKKAENNRMQDIHEVSTYAPKRNSVTLPFSHLKLPALGILFFTSQHTYSK